MSFPWFLIGAFAVPYAIHDLTRQTPVFATLHGVLYAITGIPTEALECISRK